MSRKSVVTFHNDRNETLRGVLSQPDEEPVSDAKDLVIFPNCGLMGAEGDYRSHHRIAEHLSDRGFNVMRFSPSGLGLSDGSIDPCRTRDLFGSIETGRFVGDIESAVNFALHEDRYRTVTLVGVCGGGISSLLAAARLKNVDFVVPVSSPVILDSDELEYDTRISKRHASAVLSAYWGKLLSLRAWKRLFGRQSDVRRFKRAFTAWLKRRGTSQVELSEGGFSYSPHFHAAINSIIKQKKKCLFIFGGLDRFYFEFESMFLKKHWAGQDKTPFDWHVIPNGNHMLSWVEMQMEAATKISDWLDSTIVERATGRNYGGI